MGDPSYFRLVPESCLNDWSKIPEASKKFFKDGWCHSWLTGTEHPLPETFSEFVKLLNETKFFGYLEPKLCELLLDISEFGLASTSESQRVDTSATEVGLRFYMRYLEELWFVLLVPGKRERFVGNSPKLPDPDILDDDEKDSALSVDEPPSEDLEENKIAESPWALEERAMAAAFDIKLVQEVGGNPLGMVFVDVTNSLGGWEANTLRSTLETSQMAEAMLSLPRGHPAHRALDQSLFRYLMSGQ